MAPRNTSKATTATKSAAKQPVAKPSKAAAKPSKSTAAPSAKKPAEVQPAAPTSPAKKASAAKSTAAKSPPAKSPPAKSPAKSATASKPTTSKPTASKPTTSKTTASNTTTKQSNAAPGATVASKRNAKPAAGPAPTKASKPAAPTPSTTQKRTNTMPANEPLPKPKFSKDGIGYTKDFDLGFVREMFDMLQQERIHLTGQAKRLEDEAHQLVEEAEMGDVQFDDEGGEGDTMVVERERDLALSAQARDAVAEIDAAIARVADGTYGYSVESGRPIPRERLEAIPWSSVLVEEKVGGIGRR